MNLNLITTIARLFRQYHLVVNYIKEPGFKEFFILGWHPNKLFANKYET
jgi:hypothetical protein